MRKLLLTIVVCILSLVAFSQGKPLAISQDNSRSYYLMDRKIRYAYDENGEAYAIFWIKDIIGPLRIAETKAQMAKISRKSLVKYQHYSHGVECLEMNFKHQKYRIRNHIDYDKWGRVIYQMPYADNAQWDQILPESVMDEIALAVRDIILNELTVPEDEIRSKL